MSALGIMIIVMVVLLLIGVPIGVALAFGMLTMIANSSVMTLPYMAQSLYSGLDNFTLISLPFFMLAGSIMDVGGLSKRLVRTANSLIGNITGNLGMVAILASMFFGAVSGSSMATVAAIGGVMLPEMVRAGYDKKYATALVAMAGGLGFIVPPSTPMVVYGAACNVSIGSMFMGGFGPAIVTGGLLMIVNYVYCKKAGYTGNGQSVSLKNVLAALKDSIWALLMPLIILGGIYSGYFTATEASVVACTYGIIVGMLVYKELTFKHVWMIFKGNIAFMGGLLFTLAPVAAIGALFAMMKVPQLITDFFFSITDNTLVIKFFLFLLMLAIGMIMQSTPAILLFAPILLPIAKAAGINPIHFGVFITVALSLGVVTPPVAMNLFVAQSMTGINSIEIVRKGMSFLVALIIATLIVLYVPEITLFLPRLLKMPI